MKPAAEKIEPSPAPAAPLPSLSAFAAKHPLKLARFLAESALDEGGGRGSLFDALWRDIEVLARAAGAKGLPLVAEANMRRGFHSDATQGARLFGVAVEAARSNPADQAAPLCSVAYCWAGALLHLGRHEEAEAACREGLRAALAHPKAAEACDQPWELLRRYARVCEATNRPVHARRLELAAREAAAAPDVPAWAVEEGHPAQHDPATAAAV